MRKAKPLGAIPLSLLGYMGAHARPGCKFTFTVSGFGRFPEDMLRYDGAIALWPAECEGRERREVRIVHARGCTPERWRSFGWSVHPDLVEVAA